MIHKIIIIIAFSLVKKSKAEVELKVNYGIF